MDHLIDFIIEYMYMDKCIFKEEWESGKYEKPSDCPTYPLVKAYCDAIGILNKFDGSYSRITPEYLLQPED